MMKPHRGLNLGGLPINQLRKEKYMSKRFAVHIELENGKEETVFFDAESDEEAQKRANSVAKDAHPNTTFEIIGVYYVENIFSK